MYVNCETTRLQIEPLTTQYRNFILDLVNTPGWLKFIGDRNIKNEEEAGQYVQKIIDGENFFYNVVKLKNTNTPIGILTFIIRDNLKYPDIGFAFLPAFEKKGYAFEAANAYLMEIIARREYEQVLAITIPDNSNSIKLLEKLGLQFHDSLITDNGTMSVFKIKIN